MPQSGIQLRDSISCSAALPASKRGRISKESANVASATTSPVTWIAPCARRGKKASTAAPISGSQRTTLNRLFSNIWLSTFAYPSPSAIRDRST